MYFAHLMKANIQFKARSRKTTHLNKFQIFKFQIFININYSFIATLVQVSNAGADRQGDINQANWDDMA